MKEYSNEIKWEMVTALRNCKDASLIKALIQKHGPELASAHLFCEKDPIGGNMTALHYLVMCAPDVTETVRALKLLVATKGVNINAKPRSSSSRSAAPTPISTIIASSNGGSLTATATSLSSPSPPAIAQGGVAEK